MRYKIYLGISSCVRFMSKIANMPLRMSADELAALWGLVITPKLPSAAKTSSKVCSIRWYFCWKERYRGSSWPRKKWMRQSKKCSSWKRIGEGEGCWAGCLSLSINCWAKSMSWSSPVLLIMRKCGGPPTIWRRTGMSGIKSSIGISCDILCLSYELIYVLW